LTMKIILASEGAGTATGEAKIIFCKILHPCLNLEYYIPRFYPSFTFCKGGLIIQEDDYYER
jgi:hypothetical protein